MTSTLTSAQVAEAIRVAIPYLATRLPVDVRDALVRARAAEDAPRGCTVLDNLLDNADIAASDGVPICQDTGTVWASLEVGPDVLVPGDVFAGADAAVASAYESARLRKSLVRDAVLDRQNTGDNTPAFTDVHLVDEPGACRLHLMLKGGGSDNASRVVMLVPGAGRAAIVEEVARCVREKAANACAPLVIGVGIGSTFDKVGGLAKRALMRRIGEAAPDEATAQLERELLEAANGTGAGPGGLGGRTAALAVRVATAPCHIAALPLAINMGCSALRRATLDLSEGARPVVEQLEEQLYAGPAHQGAANAGPAHGAAASADPATADGVNAAQPLAQEPIRLGLPLDREQLKGLRAGDACLLTGPLYTLRDAGHTRLMEEMAANGGVLPYGLEGQAIFYAGPTPAANGRPFGAVGPTTASRMDFAAPALHDAGVAATVGKGRRAREVRDACARNGAVYFTATGGAAALLARQVSSAEVVAYGDLGTEALRRIEVEDFPVFVAIDATGADLFDEV